MNPDARPIRKGRLGKPVEFGYKAQVMANATGIILDYSVHIGNPSDTGLIRPAIERVTAQFAAAPVWVTADRGCWDSTIEADLTVAGVTTVVIPRTGKASQARAAIEHADTFITAVRWRTGCEGRISHLKRGGAPACAVTTVSACVRPQRVRPQPRQTPSTSNDDRQTESPTLHDDGQVWILALMGLSSGSTTVATWRTRPSPEPSGNGTLIWPHL